MGKLNHALHWHPEKEKKASGCMKGGDGMIDPSCQAMASVCDSPALLAPIVALLPLLWCNMTRAVISLSPGVRLADVVSGHEFALDSEEIVWNQQRQRMRRDFLPGISAVSLLHEQITNPSHRSLFLQLILNVNRFISNNTLFGASC